MKNIVVITGAGSGIGKELLKGLLNKEKNIDEAWVLDFNKESLDTLTQEIPKVVGLHIDLTKQEELVKYEDKLKKEEANIKVLVNCAGFGIFDHSENIELNTKLNMIDLNIKGYVSMIDYSLPYMNKGSKIMNIASCAAFQPIPYINCYASTKAFVLSYSRALNQELKYRDIHVLAVTPFWTKTKFFDRAVMKDKKEVVIKYSVMYEAEKVAAKAIDDLYTNKEVSVYGKLNKFQRFLTKILPHSLIMKIWMNQQKYDGTPNIR